MHTWNPSPGDEAQEDQKFKTTLRPCSKVKARANLKHCLKPTNKQTQRNKVNTRNKDTTELGAAQGVETKLPFVIPNTIKLKKESRDSTGLSLFGFQFVLDL